MGRNLDANALLKAMTIGLLTYVAIFMTLSYIEFKGGTHYLVINRQASVENGEYEPCESLQAYPSEPPINNQYTYEVEYELYDIPLDEELQVYAIAMAKAYDLDPCLVFAIMKKESRYQIDAVSPGGGNVGLMQINYSNFKWLSKELGITDFQDPYNNIQAGCLILSILSDKYKDTDKVLMAYNQGEGSAQTFWKRNIYTSHYTHTIHRYMEELEIETTKKIDTQ